MRAEERKPSLLGLPARSVSIAEPLESDILLPSLISQHQDEDFKNPIRSSSSRRIMSLLDDVEQVARESQKISAKLGRSKTESFGTQDHSDEEEELKSTRQRNSVGVIEGRHRRATHGEVDVDSYDLVTELPGGQFVLKSDFLFALTRVSRLERLMDEHVNGKGSFDAFVREHQLAEQAHRIMVRQLSARVDELGSELTETVNRVRDDKHRLENTADKSMKTTVLVQQVSEQFLEAKEVLHQDIQRMAKSIQVLEEDLKQAKASIPHPKKSHHGSLEAVEGVVQDSQRVMKAMRTMEPVEDEEVVTQFQKQITEQRRVQNTLLQDVRAIKHEISSCLREGALQRFDRRLQDVQEYTQKLEEHVNASLLKLRQDGRADVMDLFAERFNPYHATRLYSTMFRAWVAFVKQLAKAREALRRTKHVYAKTHVTARLRSWWYVMQREHASKAIAGVTESLAGQEARLDNLRTNSLRHERVVADQAKGILNRIVEVEKNLLRNEREKAREDDVNAKFEALDVRLKEEYNLMPLKKSLKDLQEKLGQLEATKMDAIDMERDRKQVADMSREHKAWLQHHDEVLKTKANVGDVEEKADAKIVEQVMVLLAKQADQLARLVAQDMEQVKQALRRFFEISPDFRKASLAIVLEPTEQCASCRPLRKMLPEGATGADGTVYRLAGEDIHTAREHTQKILSEHLRFPTVLSSSLAMGEAIIAPSSERQGSPLPVLRSIFAKESGWLKAKDMPLPTSPAAQQARPASESRAVSPPQSSALANKPRSTTPSGRHRVPTQECILPAQTSDQRPMSSRKYFPGISPSPPSVVAAVAAATAASAASTTGRSQSKPRLVTPRVSICGEANWSTMSPT